MENKEIAQESTVNNTPIKGKIFSSRLLKYSLIIIFVLAILWLISTFIISFLTIKSMEVCVDSNVVHMIETISEFIKIDVSGVIGTIATAVIARYGLREVSANIAKKDYNSKDS